MEERVQRPRTHVVEWNRQLTQQVRDLEQEIQTLRDRQAISQPVILQNKPTFCESITTLKDKNYRVKLLECARNEFASKLSQSTEPLTANSFLAHSSNFTL